MTVSESHFNNWTVSDHELAKPILKIHIVLITVLQLVELIFALEQDLLFWRHWYGRKEIVVFLSTSEKRLSQKVTTASSFIAEYTCLGGYKWLNWQECCKCHTKCQQGRKVTGTNSQVQWQCQESFYEALWEFRQHSGLISCHPRHIITSNPCRCWERIESNSVVEVLQSFTWVKGQII